MVRMVADRTGRFPERQHYRPEEIDRECERIITSFLRSLHGKVTFPIETDDLIRLIERDAKSIDSYADLSAYGANVEGVTEFKVGERPVVRIAAELMNEEWRENRLRTTLTHEYGHVHFHAHLWASRPDADLFEANRRSEPSHCKRETMLQAPDSDWMEWQAGYACGAFLMPLSALRRCVATHNEKHRLFGAVTEASEQGAALIGAVSAEFGASKDAARVRLRKLGHLTSGPASPSLFT